MYQIRKTFKFEASHLLYGLPKNHPCGRGPSHGHSYKVELFLQSEALDNNGFIVDFSELRAFKILYIDYPLGLDHSFLNDKVLDIIHSKKHLEGYGRYFSNLAKEVRFQTTAENLAELLFKLSKSMFPQVSKVRVHETDTGWGEYWE